MRIFAIIVNDDGENPNEAGLNVRASIEFVVLLVFYLDMCRDSRTLAAGEAAFAGIIYDLNIVCNRGILAVSFNSMLLAVVGEDDLTVVLDLGRSFVVARAPFVVVPVECDLLLRNSHGDSAGDSGVDFLLCGREDYIECLFASIADRGFCIVLIRPCERALNRLAVKGCRAAVQFEVEQLIAVGGAKIFQIECRLVLIRSRRSYNCLIFGHAVKLRPLLDLGFLLFPVDRNGQIARIKLVKRIVCCRVQRDGNGIGGACLEVITVIRIPDGFRAYVAIIASRDGQTAGHVLERKGTLCLALAKAYDGQRRIGDLLRGDLEGGSFHVFASRAAISFRGGCDGVCTDVCGILGGDSQLIAGNLKATAGVAINTERYKASDVGVLF